jgi:P-type E1-E2 ATPase
VILCLHLFFATVVTSSETFSGMESLVRVVDNFTIAICLIIVSVPEGLPLAIGIVLAFSVRKLKEDKVLIKNLASPEEMGQIQNICTGKTATLTLNDMSVVAFYANSRLVQNKKKNSFVNCDYEDEFVELVRDCILINCESRLEINEESRYEPVGNGTECGLLRML